MGLAETQRALARLYTDAEWRARFFRDPAGVGAELGLRPEEAEQLAQVSARKADYFAASLVNKRLGEVTKLLPLTARVLGQEFRKLFRAFAAGYVPRGVGKHTEDAIAFAGFMRRGARLAGVGPEWLPDLLAYEREWLKASRPRMHLGVRLFRCAVERLARSVARDPSAPDFDPRPTLALWLRLTPRGKLHHRAVPLPRLRHE